MTYYHRTLCHSSGITHSVLGNFLDEKKEDIIVSTGRILKLLRFEPDNKVIQTLISEDTYDPICSLSKFRRKDQTKDWFVFTTDSGNATMLAVDAEKMSFELVLQEDVKAKISRPLSVQHLSTNSHGCAVTMESNLQDMFNVNISRKVPGLHLAVDSQGRAIFIAAVESLKQLWFFPSPDHNFLEILDFSEEKFLIYDIASVDINSENPVIAYLGTAYEEIHVATKYEIRKRQKPTLVFCEGKRKESIVIKQIKCLDHANSLISVPGEKGVLVCAEDYIAYYSMHSSDIIRCSIPKRILSPKDGVIFVCSTRYNEKNSIDYLAQTEQGDIFKIQLIVNGPEVTEIILKYLITLPVASALCTLESGFLFVASEFGDHHFYKIADIEKNARCHFSFSSALAPPKGKNFFMPHTMNIAPVAVIKSMSPIMQMEFAPPLSNRSRMCLATGRASLSALKISALQQDVSYEFRVKIAKERDEIPLCMWAIESTKSTCKDRETLIIVSFENSTAVYSLDEAKEFVMKKMEESLFATDTSTIGCAKTGEDAIVQICPEGICLIADEENNIIHQSQKTDPVINYAMNKKSLLVAFGNKQLKHHEIGENGHVKKPKIPRRLLNGPVTCMLLSDSSESDQMLAVGISIPASPKTASSVRSNASVNEVHLFIVSVSEIKVLCMLKVENSPYSFLFMKTGIEQESLLVGCEDGTLLTLIIEEIVEETTEKTDHTTNSQLSVTKSEKIGSEAVQLLYVPFQKNLCILAVSNHSWLKKADFGDFIQLKSDLTPCLCILPEKPPLSVGIATILEDSFRIFLLKNLQYKPPVTIPLEYTPKKFAIDSSAKNVFIIEADANSYTEETTEKKRKEFKQHVVAAQNKQPASKLPPVENIPQSWASVFRVFNLSEESASEVHKSSFNQNEAALSLCHLEFDENAGNLLLVGVAKNFNLSTACCTEASIHTFKMEAENSISFLHKTHIKSAPLAMCQCDENVLIGMGRKLAIYCLITDSFELRLLCEKKDCVSNSITAIYLVKDRILVSDSKFGISCLIYDSSDNSLHLLDRDIASAELTAACIINDYQIARATKSRDIFIMSPDTIRTKCQNFLSELIILVGDETAGTTSNVKKLIQNLIDGVIEPEEFSTELEKELQSNHQPYIIHFLKDGVIEPEEFSTQLQKELQFNYQPYLTHFLKKSLPHVQLALISGEMMIEGITPPPVPVSLQSLVPATQEKLLACFHVGEVVTSLQQFKTFPNEPDTVVYTTLSGSVGMLSPIPWEKDAKFLNSLNTALLKTVKEIDKNRCNLKLSQHFQFRSRHFKCENVIDGDFLDKCLKLEVEHQMTICEEMEEEDITEISARLESIRRETMLDFQF